jgi:hypothetical protein
MHLSLTLSGELNPESTVLHMHLQTPTGKFILPKKKSKEGGQREALLPFFASLGVECLLNIEQSGGGVYFPHILSLHPVYLKSVSFFKSLSSLNRRCFVVIIYFHNTGTLIVLCIQLVLNQSLMGLKMIIFASERYCS